MSSIKLSRTHASSRAISVVDSGCRQCGMILWACIRVRLTETLLYYFHSLQSEKP